MKGGKEEEFIVQTQCANCKSITNLDFQPLLMKAPSNSSAQAIQQPARTFPTSTSLSSPFSVGELLALLGHILLFFTQYVYSPSIIGDWAGLLFIMPFRGVLLYTMFKLLFWVSDTLCCPVLLLAALFCYKLHWVALIFREVHQGASAEASTQAMDQIKNSFAILLLYPLLKQRLISWLANLLSDVDNELRSSTDGPPKGWRRELIYTGVDALKMVKSALANDVVVPVLIMPSIFAAILSYFLPEVRDIFNIL